MGKLLTRKDYGTSTVLQRTLCWCPCTVRVPQQRPDFIDSGPRLRRYVIDMAVRPSPRRSKSGRHRRNNGMHAYSRLCDEPTTSALLRPEGRDRAGISSHRIPYYH